MPFTPEQEAMLILIADAELAGRAVAAQRQAEADALQAKIDARNELIVKQDAELAAFDVANAVPEEITATIVR